MVNFTVTQLHDIMNSSQTGHDTAGGFSSQPAILQFVMGLASCLFWWCTFVVVVCGSAVTTKAGQNMCWTLTRFWGCLFHFWIRGGSYQKCPYFREPQDLQARVQVFSLALIMTLWDKPHYRNGTFQQDMVKNLRNVAVPGTGVPLSLLCFTKVTTYCFLIFGYPILAFLAALNAVMFHADECQTHNGSDGKVKLVSNNELTIEDAFKQKLLTPQDWFSFWRLNCRLATFHSYVTHSKEYRLEDKWTFLQAAKQQQVPVSPSLDLPGVILKHRNEEGGMGFARYFSPTGGGEWIIQPILRNGPEVARLLPEDAPLSTFRVITASRHGIPSAARRKMADHGDPVQALSVVFRAGLAGAATDHQSILFDVDMKTGVLRQGTTNSHWYQLGPHKVFSTPWTSSHNISRHPDTQHMVKGERIPSIAKILSLAVDAHRKLCPEVPLVGWDVALTSAYGMLLLEGNFSCNFFRGQFDLQKYTAFVHDYFDALAPAVGL